MNNRYNEEEIDKMYVVNIGGNDLQYASVVMFRDEPEVDYLYTYKNDTKQIIQIDAINKKENGVFKHLEN